MKKLLIVFPLFLPLCGVSQEDYKAIAQETCDCINKKDLSNGTKKSIEMALGLCMLEVIQARNNEVDVSDGDAMRKFGEKVGVQMAPICPAIFTKLAEADESNTSSTPASESVNGVIKNIEEKEFLFVTFKDETNREIRLVWLRHVEGADEFLNDYKKLIGKKAKLKYQNLELFNAKAKGYFGYKELLALELD